MKKTPLTLVLAGILGLSCMAAEKITTFEFAADPGLKTVKEPNPGQKTTWLKTFLPIPATNGNSFVMEFDLNIKTFNHYGTLMIGLDNGKTQCFDFVFNKDDSRINRCHLRAQAVKGLAAKIKPFENIKPGKMRAAIDYNASERMVVFSLSDSAGKELFSSGKIKVAGKVDLNRFVIGVTQNEDEAGEISYDPSAGAIFCRSYVGVEGEYPYAVEALVDNVAINTESAD